MSLIDFAGKLLQDPATAQNFLADPESALQAAGLAGVTPDDVRAVLPGVSDAIPTDHPLQSFIQPETGGAPAADPDARHYYQLGEGDQVLNGVAGQSILRPDGSSVLVGSDDIIVPADGKVVVLQPGDEAIPGFAGMIVRHADGTVTDAGIDTILVPQDEVFVPAGGAPEGGDPAEVPGDHVQDSGDVDQDELIDILTHGGVLDGTNDYSDLPVPVPSDSGLNDDLGQGGIIESDAVESVVAPEGRGIISDDSGTVIKPAEFPGDDNQDSGDVDQDELIDILTHGGVLDGTNDYSDPPAPVPSDSGLNDDLGQGGIIESDPSLPSLNDPGYSPGPVPSDDRGEYYV